MGFELPHQRRKREIDSLATLQVSGQHEEAFNLEIKRLRDLDSTQAALEFAAPIVALFTLIMSLSTSPEGSIELVPTTLLMGGFLEILAVLFYSDLWGRYGIQKELIEKNYRK